MLIGVKLRDLLTYEQKVFLFDKLDLVKTQMTMNLHLGFIIFINIFT